MRESEFISSADLESRALNALTAWKGLLLAMEISVVVKVILTKF